MRVLWIRHGQMEARVSTASNLDAINALFSQREEGPLSALGRAQAERVAQYVVDKRVSALYSSPLIRARETAEPAARRTGLSVEVRPELTELRTGELPATSRARWLVEALQRAPGPRRLRQGLIGAMLVPLYYSRWRRGRTLGGEPPAHFIERIARIEDELLMRYEPTAHIAVFGHGFVIFHRAMSVMRTRAERLALWRRPYIPNGGVTEIELAVGRVPRLIRYADARHLQVA